MLLHSICRSSGSVSRLVLHVAKLAAIIRVFINFIFYNITVSKTLKNSNFINLKVDNLT